MIPRYSRPDMVAIWSPASKFKIWYEIEAHACEAMANIGVIPRENADAVWKAKDVKFDVARIDEIEATTKHDVIAFSSTSFLMDDKLSNLDQFKELLKKFIATDKQEITKSLIFN